MSLNGDDRDYVFIMTSRGSTDNRTNGGTVPSTRARSASIQDNGSTTPRKAGSTASASVVGRSVSGSAAGSGSGSGGSGSNAGSGSGSGGDRASTSHRSSSSSSRTTPNGSVQASQPSLSGSRVSQRPPSRAGSHAPSERSSVRAPDRTSVSTVPPPPPPKPTDASWMRASEAARSSGTASSYGQLLERSAGLGTYGVLDPRGAYHVSDTGGTAPQTPIATARTASISDLSLPAVVAPTESTPRSHPATLTDPGLRSPPVAHRSASTSSRSPSSPSSKSSPSKSASSKGMRGPSAAASAGPALTAPDTPPGPGPAPAAVPRTLDDVRAEVAAATALRAVRKAQPAPGGAKAGVATTLSKAQDARFLRDVSLHLARLQHGPGAWLYAVATEPGPRGGASVLLTGSSEALVRRAVMLTCARFLARVTEVDARPTAWIGTIHPPPPPKPGARDEDTMPGAAEGALWAIVRTAASTEAAQGQDPRVPPTGSLGIDDVLARARTKLARVSPDQAYDALRSSGLTPGAPPAILVDIRPGAQRLLHGGIHGSLVVERNVLEWRLDPRCAARLAIADRYDLRAIILCQEGYTSSLAAAALQELGLWNATDIVGGYEAWRTAGLPTEMVLDDWDGTEDGTSVDGASEMASSVRSGSRRWAGSEVGSDLGGSEGGTQLWIPSQRDKESVASGEWLGAGRRG